MQWEGMEEDTAQPLWSPNFSAGEVPTCAAEVMVTSAPSAWLAIVAQRPASSAPAGSDGGGAAPRDKLPPTNKALQAANRAIRIKQSPLLQRSLKVSCAVRNRQWLFIGVVSRRGMTGAVSRLGRTRQL
jgi:hypothetical protein